MTDEQLTIDDILPKNPDGGDPSYHALLEIWRAILTPAEEEQHKKVSPSWAVRIIGKYPHITYADMEVVSNRYFMLILELKRILEQAIDEDPECLNVESPEEDVEKNSLRYLGLIVDWQKAILQRELDWRCEAPWAASEIAAIQEVHKMFFGDEGLASLLDVINFQYTDADRDMLAEALEDMRKSAEG